MEALETLVGAAAIGIGATAVADLWALMRRALFGTPLPNYGLVGRWVGHFPRGTFRHRRIIDAAVIAGEQWWGWTFHYAIGVAFAMTFVTWVGGGWLSRPTLLPAMLFGVATVAAPFFLMQPGMGLGIAARNTPRPAAARIQSLVTHLVFGAGLYIAQWVLAFGIE